MADDTNDKELNTIDLSIRQSFLLELRTIDRAALACLISDMIEALERNPPELTENELDAFITDCTLPFKIDPNLHPQEVRLFEELKRLDKENLVILIRVIIQNIDMLRDRLPNTDTGDVVVTFLCSVLDNLDKYNIKAN